MTDDTKPELPPRVFIYDHFKERAKGPPSKYYVLAWLIKTDGVELEYLSLHEHALEVEKLNARILELEDEAEDLGSLVVDVRDVLATWFNPLIPREKKAWKERVRVLTRVQRYFDARAARHLPRGP